MLHKISNWVNNLSNKQLALGLIILAIPAFLIHLGMYAFTGDEAIRALVALEMKLSGNFIATTMHGAEYINKPPLWNWLILIVSKLWGSYGEWPSRLCTLFSLLGFAWLHYRFLRTEFGKTTAFLGSMMLITSGRILFYDSMLGLIDTAFSLSMYALFMVIYREGKRGNWMRLFVWSYLLMSIGFMLKGLPAIVFQGLSLSTGLLFFRQGRRLFSWQHLLGASIALAILGTYLGILSFYRPIDVYLENLLHESAKRTIIVHEWWKFWIHLIKFPLDNIYHFLPWSLLVIFWLDRHFWKKLKMNDFARYNFWIVAINLIIYWTSPQVLARYLLMFIPLFNTIGIYLMLKADLTDWRNKVFYGIIGLFIVGTSAIVLVLPWYPETSTISHIAWISFVIGLAFIILLWLYFYQKGRRLWWFIGALLIGRICFDLVVLPIRTQNSIVTQARADVWTLAAKYPDKHWYVYGDAYLREPASFYLTNSVGYIIERTWDTQIPNAIYLVSHQSYPDFPGECIDTLQTDYPELQIRIHLPGVPVTGDQCLPALPADCDAAVRDDRQYLSGVAEITN